MNEWTPAKTISAVPLNALRAFEVTARHMSMTEAGRELNVTPSAISHRLRLLETVLGCRLFKREGSRLKLTECGQALAPALTEGFDRIITALGNVQPGDPKRGLNERPRSLSESNGHAQPTRDCHAVRVGPPGCER